MRDIVSTYVNRFLHEKRRRNRQICTLLALAALVACGVFWSLHYTGIALANEANCGIEEHEHTPECYEEQKVLTCGMEESDEHTHSDSCYSTESVLICGQEEHTHTDDCYLSDTDEAAETTGTDGEGSSDSTEGTSDGTAEGTGDTTDTNGDENTGDDSTEDTGETTDTTNSKASDESGENVSSNGVSAEGADSENAAEAADGEVAEGESADIESDGEAADSAAEATVDAENAEGSSENGISLASEEDDNIASGTWGDDGKWVIDADGVLTISGTGALPDYSSSSSKGAPWYEYRSDVSTVVVEEGITSLGNYCFYLFSKVTSIELPNTLTSIGNYCFYYNTSITEIAIPEGVTKIGSCAFQKCSALTNVVPPDTLISIGSRAFESCTALENITIPASVSDIGSYAFDGCTALSSVVFEGNNLIEISRNTFSYTAIESIEIPASVTKIENWYAFAYSTLGEVSFAKDSQLTTIGFATFYASTIDSIEIPEKLSTLKKYAFTGSTIQEMILAAKDFTFTEDAFAEYSGYKEASISNLVVASTVDTMDLLWVSYASDVTFEGENWFNIADGMSITEASFDDDTITIACGNYYVDGNGVLYQLNDGETATLIYCPDSATSLTVPATVPGENGESYIVTSVGAYAAYSSALQTVTFENIGNITSIGEYAFACCTDMEYVQAGTGSDAVQAASIATALALFTSADSVTTNVFYLSLSEVTTNPVTGIEVSKYVNDDTTQGSLTVTITSVTEDNTLWTGETAKFNINISNTGNSDLDNQVVRVYVQFSDEDGYFEYASQLGDRYFEITQTDSGGGGTSTKQVKVSFYKVEGYEGYYCIEIKGEDLGVGNTLSFTVDLEYPNYSSDGGYAWVYAEIVDVSEVPETHYPVNESFDCIEYQWRIAHRDFRVSKWASSDSASFGVADDGDIYLSGLAYSIYLDSLITGEAYRNDYGKDLVTSVEFVDSITLPDELTWRDGLMEAIENGNYGYSTKNLREDGYWNSYYYWYVTIEGTKYELFRIHNTEINSQTTRDAVTLEAVYDEQKQKYTLVIHIPYYNSSTESEYTDKTRKIYFGDEVIKATVNLTEGHSIDITNNVDAVVHYTYADDEETSASATVTVTVGEADFSVNKTIDGYDTTSSNSFTAYMGTTHTFEINVMNEGVVTYENITEVNDQLTNWMYIKAEDMQSLFAEDEKHQLVITLENATLCKNAVLKEVTTENGDTAVITQQQEGYGTRHNGRVIDTGSAGSQDVYNNVSTDGDSDLLTSSAIIIIGWGDDDTLILTYTYVDGGVTYSNKVTIGSGQTDDYASIEDALNGIGYLVTYAVTYNLTWDLGDKPLAGGETITYTYNATVKDSFMRLVGDQWWYLRDSQYIESNAYLNRVTVYTESAEKNETAYVIARYVIRDFTLHKSVTREGSTETLDTGNDSLNAGELLTYTARVGVIENGDAYSALPLVDHMSGTQALTVPVSSNPQLSTLGLSTIKDSNGVEYYILSKAGTYEDITLNADGVIADRVIVTENGGTWDTLIYVYLTFEATGRSSKSIKYNAVVLVNEQSTDEGSSYSISLSNEVWLSDHETHRLYDMVYLRGHIFGIEKYIVTENGYDDTPSNDTLVNRTTLNEGETVLYRFEIPTSSRLTLTGYYIYDVLPENYKDNAWEEADFTIRLINVDADGNVITSDSTGEFADQAAVLAEWEHQSSDDGSTDPGWYISSENTHETTIGATDEATQQFLYWTSDLSITYTGTLYVYVTLQMPSGEEWSEFSIEYAAGNLTNTLHVYELYDEVYHDVAVESSVYLHKGVASIGSVNKYNIVERSMDMQTENLYYYENDASIYTGLVQYYVVLYNEGPNNLYVTQLQDLIPDNFDFLKNYVTCSDLPVTVTTSENEVLELTGKYFDISYHTGATEDGDELVTFTISEYTGTDASDEDRISYDDEEDMCYLAPGEVLVFTYYCTTGSYDETSDFETNTIAMPFYDYTGGGVTVSDDTVHVTVSSDADAQNDGNCVRDGKAWAYSEGLNVETGDEHWLYSKVTVTRGEIIPGITKTVTSATSEKDVVTENPVSVTTSDTISWKVRVSNSGDLTLVNYTLTDVMQDPYIFAGTFTYYVNGLSDGIPLFEIDPEGYTFDAMTGQATTIKITYKDRWGTNSSQAEEHEETLTVGGSSVEINCRYYDSSATYESYSYTVRFYYDTDGNMVFEITFPDDLMALLPGGDAYLTFDTTWNANYLTNSVYYNAAYITPTQEYDTDSVTQGANVTEESEIYYTNPADEDDTRSYVSGPSLRSSALISVTYGYATTSVKSVTEKKNTSNTAKSDGSTESGKTYITLSSEEKEFYYTLEVSNGSGSEGSPMTSMTIIDSLPEQDDHAVFSTSETRNSEFKVSLTENPDFKIVIYSESGLSWELERDTDYVIMFSAKTEFTTSGDWDATSNDGWYTWDEVTAQGGIGVENVRSFRIVFTLTDGNGDLRTCTASDGVTQTVLIPSGATINITFNARIADEQGDLNGDGVVDEEDTIEAGAIAWNSFGYYYKTQMTGNTWTAAAPLKVGVQVPGAPRLVKQLTTSEGTATAAEDETFRFVIYHNGNGSALALTDGWTEADLAAALNTAGYEYTYAAVTVNAGNSASETLSLKNVYQYSYDATNGWMATSTEWVWTQGESYTIVELPLDSDSVYQFSTWNRTSSSNSYTFTYNYTTSLKLTCINQQPLWSLNITKVNSEITTLTLEGAVFALYSENSDDQIASDNTDLNSLLNTYSLAYSDISTIMVDVDGNEVETGDTTWYLCALDVTGSSGTLSWSGLDRDSYYLKELVAPDDYEITEDSALQKVENEDFATTSVGVTVANVGVRVYELPLSGGTGAGTYTMGGLLLTAGAACLMYRKKKREGGCAN